MSRIKQLFASKSEKVIPFLTAGYPDIEQQLDMLYKDMAEGKLGVAATTGSWYVGITSVKTAFKKGEY